MASWLPEPEVAVLEVHEGEGRGCVKGRGGGVGGVGKGCVKGRGGGVGGGGEGVCEGKGRGHVRGRGGGVECSSVADSRSQDPVWVVLVWRGAANWGSLTTADGDH